MKEGSNRLIPGLPQHFIMLPKGGLEPPRVSPPPPGELPEGFDPLLLAVGSYGASREKGGATPPLHIQWTDSYRSGFPITHWMSLGDWGLEQR